jgi:hypothetical protein
MENTGPAITTSGPAGQSEVFAIGTNGALWHKEMQNNSSTWESLGGVCTASPAAAPGTSNTYLTFDVFVRGSDGVLWYKHYQDGWSGWTSLGGQLAPNTGPWAGSYSPFLIVQGTDQQLWQRPSTGTGWTTWKLLDGNQPPEALSTSSPAAGMLASGHTMLSVSSTNGTIWYSGRTTDGL